MNLPPTIVQHFNTRYEGFTAAAFDTSSEYHNVQLALQNEGISFLTKIVKEKRAGKKHRKFYILLVEKHGA